MTIVCELLPFLAILFLLEGVVFIRKGMSLFVTGIRSGTARIHSEGFRYRGLGFFSASFYAVRDGLLVTARGVYYKKNRSNAPLPISPVSEYSYIGFSAIQRLSLSEKDLQVDGRTIFTAQTTKLAKHLHQHLLHLASLSDRTTEDVSAPLFAVDALKNRLDEVGKVLNLMKWVQDFFFMLLYLIPAMSLLVRGAVPKPVNIVYLVLLGFFWIGGTVAFALSSKRLFGHVDVLNTVQCAVFPVSICRASMYLTDSALAQFDEISVAAALLDKKNFVGFAQNRYEMLIAALAMELPDDLREMMDYRKKRFEEIAASKNVTPQELRSGPASDDPHALCFCPVCNAEFSIELDRCATCGVQTVKRRTD